MNIKLISSVAAVVGGILALVACDSGGGTTGGGGTGNVGGSVGGNGGSIGGNGGTGPVGTVHCNDLLAGDPTMSAWDTAVATTDFVDGAAAAAYDALNNCACVAKSGDSPAGCADSCDKNISMTANDNFCNGAHALPTCAGAIASRCAAEVADCAAN